MSQIEKPVLKIAGIRDKIYTIRDVQVMLDSDLAALYSVETRTLNQAVTRNRMRFPPEFMFRLTHTEYVSLRSHSVILKSGRGQHRKYLPYAFTEQGVAMLSAVLKSQTAITVSIEIINAFIAMRKFLSVHGRVFERLDMLELNQTALGEKVEQVLDAIAGGQTHPRQGVFFDGQIFDAWAFTADLVRSADRSIVLIDNYIDDTVLTLFAKRRKGVLLTIYTKTVSRQLQLDAAKFKAQYPPLQLKTFEKSHDRFLIIDDTDFYHFGASLKDLGKKWFAFSRLDTGIGQILIELLRQG